MSSMTAAMALVAGVTPATNAVAAIMLLITLSILLGGQLLTRRRGSSGRDSSVAGMIAEQAA